MLLWHLSTLFFSKFFFVVKFTNHSNVVDISAGKNLKIKSSNIFHCRSGCP